jgi:hypothetical protein
VYPEDPMTATSGTTTTGGRGIFVAALAVAGLAAAAIGAYLDWLWWHPTQGIVVTLVAIGALLLSGLLLLFRRRPLTRLAFIGIAIGVGLLVGQWLGPSRADLILRSGAMTLHLTGPFQADATGPATCQMVASGGELQVSMDPNTRLEIEGLGPQEYPFASSSFAFGDRWQPDDGAREDGLVLSITIGPAFEPASGPIPELLLHSDSSSRLQLSQPGDVGTVQFSGLAISQGEVEAILGVDGEVTGTLEWSCDAPN